MFKPCLEIPKKQTKKFDSSLCIICQTEVKKPKRGQPQKKEASSFQVFIDVVKILEESGDTRYHNLYDVIKNKTCNDLEREEFCYHSVPCRRDFQRIHSNQKRKTSEAPSQSSKTSNKASNPTKVSRRGTVSFDKNLCLFCQLHLEDEQIINLCQDSRDQSLKEAFDECPVSLVLYKIRTSHAFDGMAGDIKYHHSCWRDKIDKRVPEVQIQVPSQPVSYSSLPLGPIVMNVNELDIDREDETTISTRTLDLSDMELRNGRVVITNNERLAAESPSDVLKEVIFAEIVEATKVELMRGRALTLNNIVEIYKTKTDDYGAFDTRNDAAIRIEIKRMLDKRICNKMKGVEFITASGSRQSQRLVTNDIKAFAQKYAEENHSLSSNAEVEILTKACKILRKRTLEFRKMNTSKVENFSIGFEDENQKFPPLLLSFFEGLLFSHGGFERKCSERKNLTETCASSVLYNIKTNRQVNYARKRKTRSRHTHIPEQLIYRTLAIRHCARDNAVLRLLSAPNFGLTLTPRTSLLIETMIANAMTKIIQKEGVYVPPNMKRGVRVSFHMDNFDELTLTFDGKNTVHYLLIVGFQRRVGEFEPLKLKLEKTSKLTLQENNFADLLPCEETSNKQFKRTDGCLNVTCSSGYKKSRSSSLFTWISMRSFEYLLTCDEDVSFISDHIKNTIASAEETIENTSRWTLDNLRLPSFAASNSLVIDQEISLTNIFSLPFIAGPASSISAVYTGLVTADRVSKIASSESHHAESSPDGKADHEVDHCDILTRPLKPPPSWKTIIVLDLDLYAKAYKLVNSRDDLRNRYVLCLGELQIVFAEIRAIGTFIDSSGIDDAWMAAEWFDSESLLRQVKECSNMKRALAAHEATLTAVNTMILQGALCWYKEIKWFDEELLNSLRIARDVVSGKNMNTAMFRDSWNQFQQHMSELNLEEKINEFVTSNKKNRMLQFLVRYSQMVTRLFTFIEATRSRDWILHLDALEDMIPDFASMNRINYRRYAATYVADMRHLQTSDIETWNYFKDGNFCCQKNDIPFTAIGRDHCGEQENKVLKGRGGVAGQSSNSNSTNRYFMTAPVLAQIYSDMERAGGEANSKKKFHHQLGKAYTDRQNKWITSLLLTFEKHGLCISSE